MHCCLNSDSEETRDNKQNTVLFFYIQLKNISFDIFANQKIYKKLQLQLQLTLANQN